MNTIATCRGAFNQHLIFCNVHNVRKFSKAFCLHNSPLKTPNDSYLVQTNLFALSQQNSESQGTIFLML